MFCCGRWPTKACMFSKTAMAGICSVRYGVNFYYRIIAAVFMSAVPSSVGSTVTNPVSLIDRLMKAASFTFKRLLSWMITAVNALKGGINDWRSLKPGDKKISFASTESRKKNHVQPRFHIHAKKHQLIFTVSLFGYQLPRQKQSAQMFFLPMLRYQNPITLCVLSQDS